MRYKFIHTRPIVYTKPAFVAQPGETYELDKAPDSLHWRKARELKTTDSSTNEEENQW